MENYPEIDLRHEHLELKFPKDFMWGTSTSSHQVEGHNMLNDWWEWEQKGKVLNRQISGDACNHYYLYKKDFEMMKKMHHNTHRLSIEWSRIEPKQGEFNKEELKHYRRVVQELVNQGIRPMITLHHFTLPHWFAKQGGFLHPDARNIFNRYVRRVVEEIGDLVEYWVTINEPFVYADQGYLEGIWPPGEKSLFKLLKVVRVLFYIHLDTYKVIKEIYNKNHWGTSMVGFVNHMIWFDESVKHTWLDKLLMNAYRYVFNKSYYRAFYSGRLPIILGYDKVPEAKTSLDFIGINYYFRCICKFSIFKGFRISHDDPGRERSLSNWEVYPEGLYNMCKLLGRKLKKPIIITENGISTLDDNQRISYIIRHLEAIHRAMSDGVDIRGYLYWSFMDNFEWAEGYTQPFGLVNINYRTFERIPKSSAQVFAEICKTSTVTDNMIKKHAKGIREKLLRET